MLTVGAASSSAELERCSLLTLPQTDSLPSLHSSRSIIRRGSSTRLYMRIAGCPVCMQTTYSPGPEWGPARLPAAPADCRPAARSVPGSRPLCPAPPAATSPVRTCGPFSHPTHVIHTCVHSWTFCHPTHDFHTCVHSWTFHRPIHKMHNTCVAQVSCEQEGSQAGPSLSGMTVLQSMACIATIWASLLDAHHCGTFGL